VAWDDSYVWCNDTDVYVLLSFCTERGVRMFERDKNAPCILMWSLGNESGYGAAHLAMAGYLRARDDSRVVSF
jgi:beta-galactosidase/beta-glucuronidase